MTILLLLQLAFAHDDPNNPIQEFKVEGQVQKPEIYLQLRKGDTSKAYELELRESFIPKILDSMKKEPL